MGYSGDLFNEDSMKRGEIKKLDKLWGKLVKEEAKFKCEICQKSGDECQLHPHHQIGRRHRSLRWWLPNGVCLCASHHTMGLWSAHENPEWYRTQMLDIRGLEWLRELQKRANLPFKGTYQQVLDYLEGRSEDYL